MEKSETGPNSESCVTRSRHTTLVEPASAKATAGRQAHLRREATEGRLGLTGDGAERGYAFCIFRGGDTDAEIVEVWRLATVYLRLGDAHHGA